MRKFLSILLLVVFILTFPLALFFFNVNRTILSPSYYTNIFTKIDLYNRIMKVNPRITTDYLTQREGSKLLPQGPQTDADIARLMTFIPPEILTTNVNKNLNDFFSNVLDKGSPTITVNMSEIKWAMSSGILSNADRDFVNHIKDKYVIPVPPEVKSLLQSAIVKKHTMAPIYLVATIFLLLFSAVLWPDRRGKLRIPGIILLIFGILVIPIYFLLKLVPMPSFGLMDIKEFSSIISDLYNSMKLQFYFVYLWEGAGMFVLGLILIIASAFSRNDATKGEQVKTSRAL